MPLRSTADVAGALGLVLVLGLRLRRGVLVVEARGRQRQLLDLGARPDGRIGRAQYPEAGRHGAEQAAVLGQHVDRCGHLGRDRTRRMARHVDVGVGLAVLEKGDEPVVLAGAKVRLGGDPLVGAVEVGAARIAKMHAHRLGDFAAAVIPQDVALGARRAECHQLGGKTDGDADGRVAQHGPAHLIAFLQGFRNKFDLLVVGQLVGGRMALRFLPGLRRLAHRSVELALVDRVEMAGPDQRHPDVAGQDLVRRRRLFHRYWKTFCWAKAVLRQGQHGQAGRRQAAQGTKTRKKGRHDAILPRLHLFIDAWRPGPPTASLYFQIGSDRRLKPPLQLGRHCPAHLDAAAQKVHS